MDIDMNIVFPSAIGGFVAFMLCLFVLCWLGERRNAAKRARETQQFIEEAQERERRQLQNASTVEVQAVVVLLPT